MTDREPTDLDELLRVATDKVSYSVDGELIGDLITAIERLRETPLGHTLDEVWEQNQAILNQATFNGDVLQKVVTAYHEALEEEQADLAEVIDLEVPERVDTGVSVIAFYPNGDVEELDDVDTVHVVLRNGTIPVAYEAPEGSEDRVPGWYHVDGEFHRYDDRRVPRRGW